MAKKQGLQSILGAADTTLVNAAYKAAIANKPVDMREQFQNTALVHANMLKGISDNFKKIVETDKLYNQEMNDTLDPLYAQFEDGTLTDGLLESRLSKLDGFKADWKKIPKGKKGEAERSKWRNKVNRYLQDQKGIIGTLVTAGKLSKAGELHDLSSRDAQTVTAVANLHAGKTGAGATATEIDNGDGTTSYEIKPAAGGSYTVTSDELKNILPIKYHKSAENFVSINTNVLKDGKTTGLEYGDDEKTAVSNDVVNFIENQGENKSAAYRSATLYKDGGMRMSFKEALYDKEGLAPEILDGLIAAGQIPDENNDGTVDKEDVKAMKEASFNAIADAILKDHRVGSRILGDWYASTEGQRQFDKGKKMRKGSGTTPGTGDASSFKNIASKSSGNVEVAPDEYVNFATLDGYAKKMNAREPFDLGSRGSFTWNADAQGGNGSYVDETGKPVSKALMFLALSDAEGKEMNNKFSQSPAYQSVEDWYDPSLIGAQRKLGKTNFTTANLKKDDNDVVDDLNNMLPARESVGNPKGYKFTTTKLNPGAIMGIGDFTKDEVVLTIPQKQKEGPFSIGAVVDKPVVYPADHKKAGQPVVIKTGDLTIDEREKQLAILKDILKTFDFPLDNLNQIMKLPNVQE